MSPARIFDRVLLVLAIITVAGYVAAGALFAFPQLADASDQWLKNRFIEDYRTRFFEIGESDQSVDEKVESLVSLLDDLKPVQKVDQLSGIKRAAYAQAVHASILNGDTRIAEDLIKRWLLFDDKDINAELAHCRLLMHDRYLDGDACINNLLEQFPYSLAVASGASQMHFYYGQLGAAYLTLEPFLFAGGHPLRRSIGELYQSHQILNEQVPVTLSFEEGLPLEFSFKSSTSQLAIELVRISSDGGRYLKDLEHQGEIRINSMNAGEFLEITARIAEPTILRAILHPDARNYLLADLRSRAAKGAEGVKGAEDSVNRLGLYLEGR